MPPAAVPDNENERLATLYRYSILDTLPERSYDDLTALASFICGAPMALISLVDKDRQWFKSTIGVELDCTSRDESFCAYTIPTQQMLIVEDTHLDPRFADNSLVLGEPHIRFYAGAPIIAPNGHVLGTLCVLDTRPRTMSREQRAALDSLARQVTSLMNLHLRLQDYEKTAAALMRSEKLAAVGRLASSMAHEINNPLEAVTNLLFLSRGNTLEPHTQEWLDQAEIELRRVSAIANQSLRFHKQSSKPQAITCQNLISTTLDLYEGRLKNSGIAVEKRKRANEPVECFAGDIRQVLSHILTNSIDAMPAGGRLLVRSRHAAQWNSGRQGLVITIADAGTGMSRAVQSQMFEAFYTTKGIGGSGLGLWISADIMARHGGSIAIRSKVDRGTVVSLFLPLEAMSLPQTAGNTALLPGVPPEDASFTL